jgi:hypothetical protein
MPVFIFAQVLGDTGDGGDVMNFVDVSYSRRFPKQVKGKGRANNLWSKALFRALGVSSP